MYKREVGLGWSLRSACQARGRERDNYILHRELLRAPSSFAVQTCIYIA